MNTLAAVEHFSTDADMRDFSLREDRSCNGKGPLRVVRCFTHQPLRFGIGSASRNDDARRSFETSNTIRIPALHAVAREPLRLLADGVTRGNALETGHDPIRDRDHHV